MTEIADPIHHITYASQPYVTRACDSTTGYVAWEQPTPPIYKVSNGWSYCFDVKRVTCRSCAEYMVKAAEAGMDPGSRGPGVPREGNGTQENMDELQERWATRRVELAEGSS